MSSPSRPALFPITNATTVGPVRATAPPPPAGYSPLQVYPDAEQDLDDPFRVAPLDPPHPTLVFDLSTNSQTLPNLRLTGLLEYRRPSSPPPPYSQLDPYPDPAHRRPALPSKPRNQWVPGGVLEQLHAHTSGDQTRIELPSVTQIACAPPYLPRLQVSHGNRPLSPLAGNSGGSSTMSPSPSRSVSTLAQSGCNSPVSQSFRRPQVGSTPSTNNGDNVNARAPTRTSRTPPASHSVSSLSGPSIGASSTPPTSSPTAQQANEALHHWDNTLGLGRWDRIGLLELDPTEYPEVLAWHQQVARSL